MNKILSFLKETRLVKEVDVKASIIKDDQPDTPLFQWRWKKTFVWTLLKSVIVVLCVAAAIDALFMGLLIDRKK